MPPSSFSRGGPGSSVRSSIAGSGRGKVSGKTIGRLEAKRHRKVVRDSIMGITKPDIRRLARRGGVKRISGMIYSEARAALKSRLETILRDCVIYVEYQKRKTVTVHDVLHALRRLGRPIYGFDPESWHPTKKSANKEHNQEP
ncbi:histone-fold-containing protein [Stachybotrys elegans]|uniref:Histone H4 n=1 Tax=Stachybotrys elegans TaxID=80388 RepID=A0A8K0T3S1_9HYPO|nr:histone-fold-containing protein [Stachybotrys elegans]